MKAQQKRIDDLNKGSSIPQPGNSGDAGLVEQVANIVMIRVQADIEMKVQGCVTKDDFDKYISTQEVFSSTLQRDTNGKVLVFKPIYLYRRFITCIESI